MANQEWGTNDIASIATAAPVQNVRTYMVECGALLNANTNTTAHGIPSLDLTKIVDMWGVTTDGTNVHPIPYTSNADDVALVVDATNIELITFTDMTAFTASRVYISVLES